MTTLSIKILGRTYDVEAVPGDELFISSLAAYLEERLMEIHKVTGIVDTQKMAILAALNIADELFRLKNSKENISGVLDKKADEMIQVLDSAVNA